MDKETLSEVKKVIEQANNGDWFPIAIVGGCLALCIFLFIYILKMKEKTNSEKHSGTDRILEKLVENNTNINTMLAVHDLEIQNLKDAG